jgi:hypothetical protein
MSNFEPPCMAREEGCHCLLTHSLKSTPLNNWGEREEKGQAISGEKARSFEWKTHRL